MSNPKREWGSAESTYSVLALLLPAFSNWVGWSLAFVWHTVAFSLPRKVAPYSKWTLSVLSGVMTEALGGSLNEGSTLCLHTYDILFKKLKPVIYLPNWKRKLRFGWGGGFKFGVCEESSLQLISPGVKWCYPQERLANHQENLHELRGDLAKILQEWKRKTQRCWIHPQGLHQLYR